ncbi:MAG: hypothetical protein IKM04_03060 [Clostridia bacterium]|nr:hypothetical protein [Clostridia bacterium]
MNKRFDRSKLNLGVYCLAPYARTEKHIREIAESGLDFVIGVNYDKPTLDLFEKYGIGGFVNGIVPGWWGGDGDNAGKFASTHPIEVYEQKASEFVDHPAIWAIDVGDEPSALDFPHYGKVMATVDRLFDNQFAYLNLYPNYASVAQNTADQTVSQLGTATYEEHIAKYCECVESDYICYDFYLYSIDVTRACENLRIVADACLKSGRSMWIVLQVNHNRPEVWISADNMRFQAYTAMAFGAENITWACYTAGWWHNQILDDKGEKTEQYDKMKTVNHEIKTIAKEYMKYRRTATHFVGFAGTPWLEKVKQEPEESFSTGVFRNVRAENGEAVVVGQMVSRANDGSYALFVAAADDPYCENIKTYRLLFDCDRTVTALGGNGEVAVEDLGEGKKAVTLRSNEGVLIVAK